MTRVCCWTGSNHSTIDLDEKYLEAILAILSEHVPECEVWAFGSRVNGAARRFSDLDLVLVGEQPIDRKRIEALKDALFESDLPIMVDVLDWHTISESFRSIVLSNYEVLRKPENSIGCQ